MLTPSLLRRQVYYISLWSSIGIRITTPPTYVVYGWPLTVTSKDTSSDHIARTLSANYTMAYYHRVSVGSFLLKIGMLAGICFSLYIFMQFYINISSFYRKNWFLRVPKLQFYNWWHWFWFGDFAILLSFPQVSNVMVSADFQKRREISTVLIWKSI